MSAKLIEGFDYTSGTPVQRKYTVKEFQQLVKEAEKDGGKRRADKGDTFIHDKKGIMLHECWTIVPEA